MKLVAAVRKVQAAIDGIILWAIAILCAVMAICIFWQVLCRFVLHLSNNWTEELARYASVSMIFLSAIPLLSRRAHINIDILDTVIKSARGKNLVNLIIDLINIVILIPITKWAYNYMADVAKMGTTTTALNIPYSLLTGILLVSMAMCLVYSVLSLICDGSALFSKESAGESEVK